MPSRHFFGSKVSKCGDASGSDAPLRGLNPAMTSTATSGWQVGVPSRSALVIQHLGTDGERSGRLCKRLAAPRKRVRDERLQRHVVSHV